jgi:hypothetical protein
MEMSDIVLDAFVEHLRAHFYREFQEELEAAEEASWAPIRQMLQRNRNIKPWAEVQAERRGTPQQTDAEQHDLRETA